jgi:hypothetical protein
MIQRLWLAWWRHLLFAALAILGLSAGRDLPHAHPLILLVIALVIFVAVKYAIRWWIQFTFIVCALVAATDFDPMRLFFASMALVLAVLAASAVWALRRLRVAGRRERWFWAFCALWLVLLAAPIFSGPEGHMTSGQIYSRMWWGLAPLMVGLRWRIDCRVAGLSRESRNATSPPREPSS